VTRSSKPADCTDAVIAAQRVAGPASTGTSAAGASVAGASVTAGASAAVPASTRGVALEASHDARAKRAKTGRKRRRADMGALLVGIG
jgi:hypothetical protein